MVLRNKYFSFLILCMRNIEEITLENFKKIVKGVYEIVSAIPPERFEVNLDEILKGPPFLNDYSPKDKEVEEALGRYILRHWD